MQQPGTVVVAA